jgi:nicotinamide phosphoribosyltransferase
MFLKEYLSDPITLDQINEAEEIVTMHGLPFNRKGWEYILNSHGGYLPLIIRAVKEGSIIPTKNLLVSVENTDTECAWLTSFMETAILRAVW